MSQLFLSLSIWLATYRYLIIFPLAVVEGPVLMVSCGFLLRLGIFIFWPVYLVLVLGDFTADLGWYAVGYFGAHHLVKRWGKYVNLTDEILFKIENIFKKHQDKILFISKITMGFGFALATLITAGILRVSFKRYALYNFLGGFVWTGLLLGVGYFFGNLYSIIARGFKIGFIVGVAIIVLAALYGFNRYLRKKLLSDSL